MSQLEFSLTDEAKQQIVTNMQKRDKGLGVRVSVKTNKGCSGLAYVLEFADDIRDDDKIFSVTDAYAVYIDPKAFQYLKGSTMDYAKKGLNYGFEFINPNETGRCGCGESFSV